MEEKSFYNVDTRKSFFCPHIPFFTQALQKEKLERFVMKMYSQPGVGLPLSQVLK
jgi:hypothetical protein